MQASPEIYQLFVEWENACSSDVKQVISTALARTYLKRNEKIKIELETDP